MNARKRSCRNASIRSAFTLLELLVAMSISLVMLYAMILFLRYVGDTVTDGRAMIEISGQLRAVRQRLHEDLASLTVPVLPLADVGGAPGYFMYYEGPRSEVDRDRDGFVDSDVGKDGTIDSPLTALAQSPWGDFDDVLAFTIYSKNEPLIGRGPTGATVTADAAEVVWFCGFNDSPLGAAANTAEDSEMRYLFRRQFLIAPHLVTEQILPDATAARTAILNAWQTHDISVRIENTGSGWVLKGNTLADLARRENRFGIDATTSFPFTYGIDPNSIFLGSNQTFEMPDPMNPPPATIVCPFVLQSNRLGEDVQLSRCIAWDVRVYDAGAEVILGPAGSSGAPPLDAAGPSDRLVERGASPNIGSYGAFVDLAYNRGNVTDPSTYPFRGNSLFSGLPTARSKLSNTPIYDTWSSTYERDGIDQDPTNAVNASMNNIVDQGTNGYDDDGAGGVDDANERETLPPYPTPLRGIQVTIRVFDPSTKQQRQATVTGDFMPE